MKYRAKYREGQIVYEEKDGEVLINNLDTHTEAGYYVMGDIQPYRSQLTGEIVESRSRHRALLKAHNCIEIGNEVSYLKPKPVKPPPGLKQRIIEVVNSKL